MFYIGFLERRNDLELEDDVMQDEWMKSSVFSETTWMRTAGDRVAE